MHLYGEVAGVYGACRNFRNEIHQTKITLQLLYIKLNSAVVRHKMHYHLSNDDFSRYTVKILKRFPPSALIL